MVATRHEPIRSCRCGATGCPDVCDNMGYRTYDIPLRRKKAERYDRRKRNPNLRIKIK